MAFNLPQQLSLKTLPAADPTDWVRPSDWPTITDAANEIQFLVNDQYQAVYALQTTCTGIGNLYIDWGDGTINTIGATGATTTQHTYATGGTGATAGTPCSLGYTTFKIRVYGDSGVVPTQAQAMPNSTVAGANSNLSRGNGYLEAYYGDGTITSIRALWGFGMNSLYGIGAGTYPLLQYVKLPATVTGTDCIYAFYAAYNLQKVVMPTSMPNATIIDYMFYVTSLRQLVLPSDMTGVTSAIAAFGLMFWLTSVSLPASWDSCTTVQQMLTTSEKLKSVELPALGACTTFSNLFNGCGGLMQVKFNALHSSPNQTLTFTTTFSGCNNLQYVFMPATCASGTIFFNFTKFTNFYLPKQRKSSASSKSKHCFFQLPVFIECCFTSSKSNSNNFVELSKLLFSSVGNFISFSHCCHNFSSECIFWLLCTWIYNYPKCLESKYAGKCFHELLVFDVCNSSSECSEFNNFDGFYISNLFCFTDCKSSNFSNRTNKFIFLL